MNVSYSDVCLVIPTRGDVNLTPILRKLPKFGDAIVYDNSKRTDYGIFARYVASLSSEREIIATQDDDVVVTCWDKILASYRPGVLTVNYPEPYDIPWVARGAIFDWYLPWDAFRLYLNRYERDRYFTHQACDGIFALLTPDVAVLDEGSEDLEHGFAEGRVSTSSGWYDEARPLIQQRCAEIRG